MMSRRKKWDQMKHLHKKFKIKQQKIMKKKRKKIVMMMKKKKIKRLLRLKTIMFIFKEIKMICKKWLRISS